MRSSSRSEGWEGDAGRVFVSFRFVVGQRGRRAGRIVYLSGRGPSTSQEPECERLKRKDGGRKGCEYRKGALFFYRGPRPRALVPVLPLPLTGLNRPGAHPMAQNALELGGELLVAHLLGLGLPQQCGGRGEKERSHKSGRNRGLSPSAKPRARRRSPPPGGAWGRRSAR